MRNFGMTKVGASRSIQVALWRDRCLPRGIGSPSGGLENLSKRYPTRYAVWASRSATRSAPVVEDVCISEGVGTVGWRRETGETYQAIRVTGLPESLQASDFVGGCRRDQLAEAGGQQPA